MKGVTNIRPRVTSSSTKDLRVNITEISMQLETQAVGIDSGL